jgi:hypothetical protein
MKMNQDIANELKLDDARDELMSAIGGHVGWNVWYPSSDVAWEIRRALDAAYQLGLQCAKQNSARRPGAKQ